MLWANPHRHNRRRASLHAVPALQGSLKSMSSVADERPVPIIVLAGVAVCVALLARWRVEYVAHRRRVDALQWRVHVNGIRGKSTVTRIIAGMMREAGLTTIAKSTGTFAAVINDVGVDEPDPAQGPGDDPRADRDLPEVHRARRRRLDHRVHGAQARVPGGQRAHDRALQRRRAHQRPRGPPGRDGRDPAGDRPFIAVDVPTRRDPGHLRAQPRDHRGDPRGVRRQGQ